jgi:tetratricopeptide (TPR) repeat protein
MKEADGLFYRGEYRGALRLYSRAMQLDKTKAEPWVGQILSQVFLSQIHDAMVWVRQGMLVFFDHPVLTSLHGLALALDRRAAEGLRRSNEALAHGEADLLCRTIHGWILLEAKDRRWDSCFSELARSCPAGAWRMRTLMGLALERHGKWVGAAACYEAAAAANPINAFLWRRLEFCYAKAGYPRKAFGARRKAERPIPSSDSKEQILPRTDALVWIGGIISRLIRIFSRESR